MKRQNRAKGQEGFSMIEVITATALLAVTVSGFLMMSGANAALLAKEHRMGRMNYELSSMSGAGAGEATGNKYPGGGVLHGK